MLLIVSIININFTYAVIDVVANEALLLSCQGNGHVLYSNCIVKIPITPDDIAACTALKTSYVLCLGQLNLPEALVMSSDPDPYKNNPFTPCHYETGHAILYDICPTLP